MTPKAAETFGERLGGGTAGQTLARRRQRTSVPVAGAGGQRGYVCRLLASTQGPHAQLRLGTLGGREQTQSSL